MLLGSLVQPGAIIALAGDLGSGKTCLTQGIAAGLGVSEDEPVTSPTYTLMNLYQGRCELYHFDFYRLDSIEELEDLGFDEYLSGRGVVVYEWSQRFTPLGGDTLNISLAWQSEELRTISLTATGPQSQQLFQQLRQSWQLREVS